MVFVNEKFGKNKTESTKILWHKILRIFLVRFEAISSASVDAQKGLALGTEDILPLIGGG